MPKEIHQLYVEEILDFSSQYGSEIGSAYKICKLIGPTKLYPFYGDNSDTAVFRSYGKFWTMCLSHLRPILSNKVLYNSSEDFFEFNIKYKLFIEKIEIFETYNPGSVEKIYFHLPQGWTLMWQKENHNTENKIFNSRIFSPKIEKMPYPCNQIRIEINQSDNIYYSEFDAVKVIGYKSNSSENSAPILKNLELPSEITDSSETPVIYTVDDEDKICRKDGDHIIDNTTENYSTKNPIIVRETTTVSLIKKSDSKSIIREDKDYISHLPEEILIKIFAHFQLKTLSKIASVSRRFLASVNQALFDVQHLNLRGVWHKLDHQSLIWLGSNCLNLTRVDLSWCGKNKNFTVFGVCHFLYSIGSNLTTLRLSSCPFVNDVIIRSISKNCVHLQELDLSSCVRPTGESYGDLSVLKQMRHVNFYRTQINTRSLDILLHNWKDLLHLNLGNCINLNQWHLLIDTLTNSCRKLQSIDLWRSDIDSENVIKLTSRCLELQEIDLGWCLNMKSDTFCFRSLAINLGQNIRKLFLTSNRSVTDDDLYSIAENCSILEQLDILGSQHVTSEGIVRVLDNCHRLNLFDISFCCKIDRWQVNIWIDKYPHCAILVSCHHQMYVTSPII